MSINMSNIVRHFTDALVDDLIVHEMYQLDGHELTDSVLHFIKWQKEYFREVMASKRGPQGISYEDVLNEYKQA